MQDALDGSSGSVSPPRGAEVQEGWTLDRHDPVSGGAADHESVPESVESQAVRINVAIAIRTTGDGEWRCLESTNCVG